MKSKFFWINIAAASILLVVLLIASFGVLKSYTYHGESLTVPELKGMLIDDVADELKSRNLRYLIIDSVYFTDYPHNTVLEQNPGSNSKVKRNRIIYLTVTTSKPPEVRLPNLASVSLRQAVLMLESYGLKAGQLHYVPDLARNSVLGMRINGKLVEPGTEIPQGTEVDLILGDGLMGVKERVPNLTGLNLDEAILVIKGFGLNIGSVNYGRTSNRNTAVIYMQSPKPEPDVEIAQGDVIDVWLMDREEFINRNEYTEEGEQIELQDQ